MSPIAHFSGKNGTSRSVTSNIRLLLYTCKAVKDWRPEIPLMMLLEVSTAAVSSDGGQKSRVGELKAESDTKPKKIGQPIDSLVNINNCSLEHCYSRRVSLNLM